MWKCGECGCLEIAGSLEVCPACRAPRKEEEVPKAYHGGSTNGLELREESSPGSSSLTSGNSRDRSGETTTTVPRSPALSAENPSGTAPEKKQTPSDASLTDGSTPATTPVLPSLPDSSAGKTETGKGAGAGPKRK